MTLSEARAHLEGMRNLLRGQMEDYQSTARRLRAEPDGTTYGAETRFQATQIQGRANELRFDVEALDIALEQLWDDQCGPDN